jgi:23S rRNA pseudouridine2605 synthase
MFYKPVGCITSVSDEKERTTVIDFMKKIKGWKTLHPVGRLDFNTEGLLLLTNDGDYTQSILHPSKKILKTYLAKIKGQPEFTKLKRLLTGVRIKGKLIKCEKIRLKKKLKTNSWVEIKLYSGQNRIVRNLFDAIQCPVIKLTRLAIGNLSLKNYTLIPGKYILLDNTKKNLVFEEN